MVYQYIIVIVVNACFQTYRYKIIFVHHEVYYLLVYTKNTIVYQYIIVIVTNACFS